MNEILAQQIVTLIRQSVPYSSNLPIFQQSKKLRGLLKLSLAAPTSNDEEISCERIALSSLIGKIGDCTEQSKICYVTLKFLNTKIESLRGYTVCIVRLNINTHHFVILYKTSDREKINSYINQKLTPTFENFLTYVRTSNLDVWLLDTYLNLGTKIKFNTYAEICKVRKNLHQQDDMIVEEFRQKMYMGLTYDCIEDLGSDVVADTKYKNFYNKLFGKLCNKIYCAPSSEKKGPFNFSEFNYSEYYNTTFYENENRMATQAMYEEINCKSTFLDLSNMIPTSLIIDFLKKLKSKTSTWSNLTSNFSKKDYFNSLLESLNEISSDYLPSAIAHSILAYVIAICLVKRSRNTERFNFQVGEETKTGNGALELLQKPKFTALRKLIVKNKNYMSYNDLRNFVIFNIEGADIKEDRTLNVNEFLSDYNQNAPSYKAPNWFKLE
ncbi:hypothetical protein FRA_48c13630 [Francisella sp. W12-1067]|nr:hypothetical protein FRA_48c13630 [Francisella sp. W12-1067]